MLRCGAIGYARYIRHYPAGLGIVQVYICISKLKEKGNRKKHLPENMPRWHGVSSMPALGLNSGATVGTNFFLRARPTQPCGQARRWEDGFFYTEASIAGIARVGRSSCRSGRSRDSSHEWSPMPLSPSAVRPSLPDSPYDVWWLVPAGRDRTGGGGDLHGTL